MPYMVTFTINIPPMLAYIPCMDPMGIYTMCVCVSQGANEIQWTHSAEMFALFFAKKHDRNTASVLHLIHGFHPQNREKWSCEIWVTLRQTRGFMNLDSRWRPKCPKFWFPGETNERNKGSLAFGFHFVGHGFQYLSKCIYTCIYLFFVLRVHWHLLIPT